MIRRASPALLSLVLGAALAAALPAEPFTVLTYNAGLLRALGSDMVPAAAGRGRLFPGELARLAGDRKLAVIMLEEIWEEAHARAVAEALQPLGYTVVRPPDRTWAGISSGLLLAVRAPLAVTEWKFTPFAKSTFVDGLTRKGVLQAVVSDPAAGVRFAVLGTHTVAIDTRDGVPTDKGQVSAHTAQTAQILEALEAVTAGGSMPAVLMGDFNVGPGYAEANYKLIAEAPGITAAAGPLVTWDPANPLVTYGEYPNEPAARIDNVFLRGGGGLSWEVRGSQRAFVLPVPGVSISPPRHAPPVSGPLSDHYGVIAEIELARGP
jgi:hypothetical protein